MTVANIIDFNVKRNEGRQVIADTDDGFTRTANAIQDQLCQLDISGSQFQVLNAIIRSTYGYNKKQDRVTNSYLVELTGVSDWTVRDALKVLTERNIIICTKSGIMKLVAVNKVVSEWVIKTDKAANLRKGTEQMLQQSKCSDEARGMPQQVRANATNSRSKCSTTKDNQPKTTNQRQIITSQPPAADTALKNDAAIQNGKHWGTTEDLETANALKDILSTTLGEHFRAPKNMAGWANDVRLMRTADERNPKHMITLFALAHTDNFWKTTIHSPAALRKHWGRLASLHSERKGGFGNGQKGITIGANGLPMTSQDWAAKARQLGTHHE